MGFTKKYVAWGGYCGSLRQAGKVVGSAAIDEDGALVPAGTEGANEVTIVAPYIGAGVDALMNAAGLYTIGDELVGVMRSVRALPPNAVREITEEEFNEIAKQHDEKGQAEVARVIEALAAAPDSGDDNDGDDLDDASITDDDDEDFDEDEDEDAA